jgi:hypothetical protein
MASLQPAPKWVSDNFGYYLAKEMIVICPEEKSKKISTSAVLFFKLLQIKAIKEQPDPESSFKRRPRILFIDWWISIASTKLTQSDTVDVPVLPVQFV